VIARRDPAAPVRVRVREHTQVWHEGRLNAAGEELDAPAEAAGGLIANGWAEPTAPAARRAKTASAPASSSPQACSSPRPDRAASSR
jgi:hypothetical protein